MALSIGPPPRYSSEFDENWRNWITRWFDASGGTSSAASYNGLDFTASNLTSIVTRNHNDLQTVGGGASNDYFHLTAAQHGGLVTVSAKANADSPYTALSTDGILICDCTSGAITITLPAVSGTTGKRYTIKKIDSTNSEVTVDGSGSETIDDSTTAIITGQYDSITIISDGSEWWII